ncbi:hypothetical protein Y032_0678g1450 [Ancylostoma ceylanicum]|uniref:Uncharacterized protein n=1 Tax=Ancylostoma ceylanicum TaxID=53326 RepID=A0A016WIJ6_9BILA|nr:hypothetical protein Y032_0678g1450 [Ancylostoma ceylanicum]
MREEFGAKQVVLSCQIPNDCDSVSIASEATSLHSWHRRVLAETNTVVVHPSDSISTRAGPSFPALLSTSHNQPLPSIHHELEVSTWSPTDATSSSVHITSPSTTSPIGPPPSHPPPPLPPLESVRYIRNDLRSPPPLPPRNPSIRLMDSPATNLHPNPPKNTNRLRFSLNE